MKKKELKSLIQEVLYEMNLQGLVNEPRDPFDPTNSQDDKSGTFPTTKINPYDDKDFAMKSKVLHVITNYIDRKKRIDIKAGISETQKIVDAVVYAIGNIDLDNYNKNIKLLDVEWNSIAEKYPEINNKYIDFKKEIVNQLTK